MSRIDLLDALLDPFPSRSAELVEPRLRRLGAGVLFQQVEPVDGDVELVAADVLESDELDSVLVDLGESHEYSDAVIGMDDIVADLQVPEVGKEAPELQAAAGGGPGRLGEDVGGGEDGECERRHREALRERSQLEVNDPRGIHGGAAGGDARLGEELDASLGHAFPADERPGRAGRSRVARGLR